MHIIEALKCRYNWLAGVYVLTACDLWLACWRRMDGTESIHEALYRILNHINTCAGDVKWWICGGTLLGAIREGKIIQNDEDSDICIFAEDANRFIQNVSDESISIYPWWYGYRISLASSKEMVFEGASSKPWHKPFKFPFVDVFLVVKSEDGLIRLPRKTMQIARSRDWSEEMMRSFKYEFYYPEEIEQLKSTTLGELNLPIPSKVEGYLERVYGDWKKPIDFKYAHGVFAPWIFKFFDLGSGSLIARVPKPCDVTFVPLLLHQFPQAHQTKVQSNIWKWSKVLSAQGECCALT